MSDSTADTVPAPVAIVTGGAGGMGLAIATILLGDGFRVALLDRRGAREAAAMLAEAGEATGRRVLGVEVDVTDEEAVRAAVAQVDVAWGRVDALVNNAGIEPQHSLESLESGTWRVTLDVNLSRTPWRSSCPTEPATSPAKRCMWRPGRSSHRSSTEPRTKTCQSATG
ncbi:SDR family NAD(P)-dependent oxidoreductase [Streptomyces sp. MK37H]|nr:SDR family NAD(P)-dependent oxidoreductase [Streptomyces sp. MK37H]MBP8532267.1 SDR family NAD(P)-dependent oxidoreductase [Streptomyces sp. MK37H]